MHLATIIDTTLSMFIAHLAHSLSFHTTLYLNTSCYILPAERANLEISLGKTRNAPTCMHGLMISHVAVKDHVTPLRGVVELQRSIADKICEK